MIKTIMASSDPIQILHVGSDAPDLSTSAFGPFVVCSVSTLAHVADAWAEQRFDGVLMEFAGSEAAEALLRGQVLAPLVVDAAVVVVAPEPEAALALNLMRRGVEDVVAARDGMAAGLGRSLRQAVERKRMEQVARKAYSTDLGTGLPNHGQLMEHMTHLLALREREPAAMALLVVRLEGLAAVANRYGEESARVLRRKAAVRLRAGLRASDVVASLGDDSFGVLLAWIDNPSDAGQVATKLSASLQRPFSVAGQDLRLAVAVGISRYPEHGKAADPLLRHAQAQACGDASGHAQMWDRRMTAAANDDDS